MREDTGEHRYDDIIGLPHHVSRHHLQMSMENRAAQFSPFAALTGHEDAIRETGRLTEERPELDDDTKAILDGKLREICGKADSRPEVCITYFRPDERKEGGSFVTEKGRVKKADFYARSLLLEDGTRIPVDDVCQIEL